MNAEINQESKFRLRSMCFTHQETCIFELSSTIFGSSAILLGNVDNDCNNHQSLVIGYLDGNLQIFKGSCESECCYKASGLGSISCLALVLSSSRRTENDLLVCCSEGLLHIFRVENTKRSISGFGEKHINPAATFDCPRNITSATVAENDKLIVGTSNGCILVVLLPEIKIDVVPNKFPHRLSGEFPDLHVETEEKLNLIYLSELNIQTAITSISFVSCINQNFPILVVGSVLGTMHFIEISPDFCHLSPVNSNSENCVPLSMYAYSGNLNVTDFQCNEQIYIAYATLDGRIGLISLIPQNDTEKDSELNENDMKPTLDQNVWKTMWNHYTTEPFMSIGTINTAPEQFFVVACSWSGRTFIYNISGECFGVFDAVYELEYTLKAFVCGNFSVRHENPEPCFVYISGGEIIVHHSLSKQVHGLIRSTADYDKFPCSFLQDESTVQKLRKVLEKVASNYDNFAVKSILCNIKAEGIGLGESPIKVTQMALIELNQYVSQSGSRNLVDTPALRGVIGAISKLGFQDNDSMDWARDEE